MNNIELAFLLLASTGFVFVFIAITILTILDKRG